VLGDAANFFVHFVKTRSKLGACLSQLHAQKAFEESKQKEKHRRDAKDLLLEILTMVSSFNRLLKNALGVLRRALDERRGFDIIDDFPFMLRPRSIPTLFQQPV
jgi:hypothetical protein